MKSRKAKGKFFTEMMIFNYLRACFYKKHLISTQFPNSSVAKNIDYGLSTID